MISTAVLVGMSEIHVIKGPSVFTCTHIGSSVAIFAMDPEANVSGCAHMMLPSTTAERRHERPGKFADTAVPELIAMMERLGAQRRRMKVVIVGGAQVFRIEGTEAGDGLDIGLRNAAAVERALADESVTVTAKDLGGHLSRVASLNAEEGLITVRPTPGAERPLCKLRK